MPDGPKRPAKARTKPAAEKKPNCNTNETHGYLSGVYADFNEQVSKYVELVNHLHFVQARVELAEKNLSNTREHFAGVIAKCKDSVLPQDWSMTLARAKFVGVRLSEACMGLLKEHRRLSPQRLLEALNRGQYRWKTPTPFREIHGALIKQAWAAREGDDYVWIGPDPQLQLTEMRLLAMGGATGRGSEEEKAS